MRDNFLNLELVFFQFNTSSSWTICNTYSLNSSNCPGTWLGSKYTRMNRAVKGPALTELKTVQENYMIEY